MTESDVRFSLAEHYARIVKPQTFGARTPNLLDYPQMVGRFTWDAARLLLDGLPKDRGLNIAHDAVDRHAAGPCADRYALRCIGRGGVASATSAIAT